MNIGKKRKGKSSSSVVDRRLCHLSEGDARRIAAMPKSQQDQVLQFMEEFGVGLDIELGGHEPATQPFQPRWTFELGKSLVRLELVGSLSLKMYEFHEWYMKQSAIDKKMFGLKVKPIDFFGEGEKVQWLEFKVIYEVYHHDALDVSLISAWAL